MRPHHLGEIQSPNVRHRIKRPLQFPPVGNAACESDAETEQTDVHPSSAICHFFAATRWNHSIKLKYRDLTYFLPSYKPILISTEAELLPCFNATEPDRKTTQAHPFRLPDDLLSNLATRIPHRALAISSSRVQRAWRHATRHVWSTLALPMRPSACTPGPEEAVPSQSTCRTKPPN